MANPDAKGTYEVASMGVCLMDDSVWAIGERDRERDGTSSRELR